MKIKTYNEFIIEDEGGGGAFASLDSTPGMGAPTLASRGVTGSGDICLPASYNKDESSSRRNTSKRINKRISKKIDKLSFSGMDGLLKFRKPK